MNFSRLRLGIGFAVVFGIATATAGLAQYNANPDAPIVPPAATPAPNLTAPPSTAPTARPKRGRRAPGPTGSGSPGPTPSDTPEPPQFTTLDGVWEVEMQPIGQRLATYTHLGVTSTGANVTGYWETGGTKVKNRVPMTGAFDGRLISLSITMADGSTATFTGYVEGFADMVGIFRKNDKDPGTAFTAEHRKKLKG